MQNSSNFFLHVSCPKASDRSLALGHSRKTMQPLNVPFKENMVKTGLSAYSPYICVACSCLYAVVESEFIRADLWVEA